MSEQRLREQLEHLRKQVSELAAGKPESLDRLNGLITDIERRLESGGDASQHERAVASLKEAIRHFEVEHPRATAILNDLMVTLSNMGI